MLSPGNYVVVVVVLLISLTTFAWIVQKLLQILDNWTIFLHQISYLQNAIWGSSSRKVNINVRHSWDFRCLLLILETNTDARDFLMFHTGVRLWAQLRELSEEPMSIFKETILMDCVKFVPVLICSIFIFLWKKRNKNIRLTCLQIILSRKSYNQNLNWSPYSF